MYGVYKFKRHLSDVLFLLTYINFYFLLRMLSNIAQGKNFNTSNCHLKFSTHRRLRTEGCWGDTSVNKVPAMQVRGHVFDLQNPHKNVGHGDRYL